MKNDNDGGVFGTLITPLQKAIHDAGYDTPTPIQSQAIPPITEGRDLVGSAQTGTGKTAAFTLPLLQRLADNKERLQGNTPRALVLAPTRELAAQIGGSIETYSKHLSLRHTVIFGGVKQGRQVTALNRGVDILVATPGRLLDLMNQKFVYLDQVEFFILDEVDRMLDMGFIHDIRKLLALLPKQKQTLLFSATFSDDIKKLADGLLKSPAMVEVARRNTTVEIIDQVVHPVDKGRKRELLSFLIGSNNWQQVLVFGRTKHGANRLAKQLITDGINAAAIHGNKSQGARTQALADFKMGKVQVLVATDIAARGLDIEQLPHVINYELPNVAEDYVHRIGRTGRAGREGQAISLVCGDEMKQLKDIERLIKRKIPQQAIDGYNASEPMKAETRVTDKPPQQRRRRRRGNSNQRPNARAR